MNRTLRIFVSLFAVGILALVLASPVEAGRFPVPRMFQGTRTAMAHVGFSPTIIAVGEERQLIESMPILQRPYRPLHFYGNTVRRRYYRQLMQ